MFNWVLPVVWKVQSLQITQFAHHPLLSFDVFESGHDQLKGHPELFLSLFDPNFEIFLADG